MSSLNSQIRAIAMEMGADAVGFASISEVSDSEIARYKNWLSHGNHAGMSYLERYMEQRQHPQLLLPQASSVIILAVSYYPPQRQDPSAPKVAKYALGRDYHKVMKRLLLGLAERIHAEVAPHSFRAIVDTAPFWSVTGRRSRGLALSDIIATSLFRGGELHISWRIIDLIEVGKRAKLFPLLQRLPKVSKSMSYGGNH